MLLLVLLLQLVVVRGPVHLRLPVKRVSLPANGQREEPRGEGGRQAEAQADGDLGDGDAEDGEAGSGVLVRGGGAVVLQLAGVLDLCVYGRGVAGLGAVADGGSRRVDGDLLEQESPSVISRKIKDVQAIISNCPYVYGYINYCGEFHTCTLLACCCCRLTEAEVVVAAAELGFALVLLTTLPFSS